MLNQLLESRWLILGLVGAIMVGLGVFGVRYYDAEKTEIEIIKADDRGASPIASVSGRMVVVEVAGAVFGPGVYSLPEFSRVDDLIVVAGGMTAKADRDWIEKHINRASRLQDGLKLYIPRLGEMERIAGSGVSTVRGESRVGINTAPRARLESLEGIGAVTAGRVMEGRPYTRLEELVERKILSQSLFFKLKPELSLD